MKCTRILEDDSVLQDSRDASPAQTEGSLLQASSAHGVHGANPGLSARVLPSERAGTKSDFQRHRPDTKPGSTVGE